MSALVLEIGMEEMPARFVKPAMDDLGQKAAKALLNAGLLDEEAARGIETYGTPRRLCLMVHALADRQPDRAEEALGPPVAAGFDKDGNPTKAALGFAKSQGVTPDRLATIETAKGPRLGVVRKIAGRAAAEVLAELLPQIISGVSFPKNMRWGSEKFRFARPIHWILALLDGAVIHFELAGIKTGNQTRGHRFMAPAPIEINGHEDYLVKLEQAFVVADRERRRGLVEEEVRRAAASSGGDLVPDDALLEEVTDLVELPVACLGSFDKEFLAVPRAVIVSAMREHQRYFALEDGQGNLLPNFVAVNNTRPKDLAVVARGHEKVLRARLADARFFLTEDTRQPLIDYLEELKKVTYHAKLGTSYEKVSRVVDLAEYLAGHLAPELAQDVSRAAWLAKCDLVTEMVGEFPSLQGVVGAEYARRSGEKPEVAQAVSDHYLPTGAGGELPRGLIGAVVGLADRMDSICGMFGIGQSPTGAADPYGLRRAANAIIRIVTAKGLKLSFSDFLAKALSGLAPWLKVDAAHATEEVTAFFAVRFASLMAEAGAQSDVAEAVLAAGFDDFTSSAARAAALAKVKDSEDFAPLAMGMKRVMNILRKESEQVPETAPDPKLMSQEAEVALFNSFQELEQGAAELFKAGDYDGFIKQLTGLKGPIDLFFDEVLVMDPDMAVRSNRLALLNRIGSLFGNLAMFDRLQLA